MVSPRTMRTMRRTATTIGFAVVLFACRTASANPGITGYSGKPYGGTTETCVTNCHANGGGKPTLTIDVPSALTANATGQVSITVSGSSARTSLNAALSDGVTATAGQNTTVPFPTQTPGEVAAVSPPPGGGSATYKFSFVAPNKNGPIMLWVAGMAASGSGTGGDAVSFATRTITISGATATNPPGKDAGNGNGNGTSDGGTSGASGNGGESNGVGASGSGDDDDDRDGTTSSGSGRRLSYNDSDSGCATAPSGTAAGSAASAAMAASIVALLRQRRRRSSSS